MSVLIGERRQNYCCRPLFVWSVFDDRHATLHVIVSDWSGLSPSRVTDGPVYLPACLASVFIRLQESTRKLDVVVALRRLTIGVLGDPEGSSPRCGRVTPDGVEVFFLDADWHSCDPLCIYRLTDSR